MPPKVFFHRLPCLLSALLATLLLVASSSAFAADLEAAEQAMRSRDYETAIREAQPLAEQGNSAARQLVEIAKAMLEAKREHEESLAAARAAAERFAAGKRAYDLEDYDQARREWLVAADAGNRDAQFWLGELHSQGKGVDQNFDTAHLFYVRAALQGHPQAQFIAGQHLLLLKDIGEEQKAIAFNLLLRAATNGETHAYGVLAWAYCEGIGTEKNVLLADLWQTLALDHPKDYGLLEGMQCDFWAPVTESYRQELLQRAKALMFAYDLKHTYPPEAQ